MKRIDLRKPGGRPGPFSFIFAVLYWVGVWGLIGCSIAPTSHAAAVHALLLVYGAMCLLVVYAGFIRREIPIAIGRVGNGLETFRGGEAVALGLGYLAFNSLLLYVFITLS